MHGARVDGAGFVMDQLLPPGLLVDRHPTDADREVRNDRSARDESAGDLPADPECTMASRGSTSRGGVESAYGLWDVPARHSFSGRPGRPPRAALRAALAKAPRKPQREPGRRRVVEGRAEEVAVARGPLLFRRRFCRSCFDLVTWHPLIQVAARILPTSTEEKGSRKARPPMSRSRMLAEGAWAQMELMPAASVESKSSSMFAGTPANDCSWRRLELTGPLSEHLVGRDGDTARVGIYGVRGLVSCTLASSAVKSGCEVHLGGASAMRVRHISDRLAIRGACAVLDCGTISPATRMVEAAYGESRTPRQG